MHFNFILRGFEMRGSHEIRRLMQVFSLFPQMLEKKERKIERKKYRKAEAKKHGKWGI
jgi:hypothetical protein